MEHLTFERRFFLGREKEETTANKAIVATFAGAFTL
jgi:hypothetical protein